MRAQRVEVALGANFGVVERGAQLVVGDLHATAAMRAARRQQDGLVGPELSRRADMAMAINNHVTPPILSRVRWRLRCVDFRITIGLPASSYVSTASNNWCARIVCSRRRISAQARSASRAMTASSTALSAAITLLAIVLLVRRA